MKSTIFIRPMRLIFFFLVALIFTSCNRDFPNILEHEYPSMSLSKAENKVLLIVVDGLRGEVLNDINPDNLRYIARKSLYTHTSISDFETEHAFTKERGLANIFTGVTSEKHRVESDDLSVINTNAYPTIFERLKRNYEGFSSTFFSSNSQATEYLGNKVDKSGILSSDEEVCTAVIESIEKGSDNLIIGHFSAPASVGNANGYESDNSMYIQSVHQFDKQVGEMVRSISKRPNVKAENWLVVVTSSIGGEVTATSSDITLYADGDRNTFTYIYSPKFTKRYLPKPSTEELPFIGNSLRLNYLSSGFDAVSARLADSKKLNFGNSDSFSFTFFFRNNRTTPMSNWPVFLSKRSAPDVGNGWHMGMHATNNSVFFALGGKTLWIPSIVTAKWYAITVVIDRVAGTMKMYSDGVQISTETISATLDLRNNTPLILGRVADTYGSNTADVNICNLQFYNKALSAQEVADNAGTVLLTPSSPLYENLLGYWPSYKDVDTRRLTDVTGKAGNLELTTRSTSQWSNVNQYVPFFKASIDNNIYLSVPNQVDISFFIYQWFGVLPKAEWSLDGKAWAPPYAIFEY